MPRVIAALRQRHFESVTTDENDSDEILTQVGLSTEVIEQGLPFALSVCGFTEIWRQRLWGSGKVHCVFSESVSVLCFVWRR